MSKFSTFTTASFAVARRTILKFMRTPSLIVAGTLQGSMFLVFFRYLFGGAIKPAGLSYVDFLVPGFIATSVLFVGMNTSTGMAEDVESGLLDRFRSLPIPRSATLAGRVLGDTAMITWNLIVTAALGFAVGFRLHGSFSGAVEAFALCMLFGFVFCWLFATIGLLTGSAQAAQGISFLVFPLTFISSAYVPVATMPSWLRPVAQHQPITMMVNAVRALSEGHAAAALLGHTTGYYVVGALLWSAIILAIFAPAAVMRYRHS